LKSTVLLQAEAKRSKLNMLAPIGLRLRQHYQFFILLVKQKQFLSRS